MCRVGGRPPRGGRRRGCHRPSRPGRTASPSTRTSAVHGAAGYEPFGFKVRVQVSDPGFGLRFRVPVSGSGFEFRVHGFKVRVVMFVVGFGFGVQSYGTSEGRAGL